MIKRSALAAALAVVLLPAAVLADITGAAWLISDTLAIAGQHVRLHGIDAPEKGQPCRLRGLQGACGITAWGDPDSMKLAAVPEAAYRWPSQTERQESDRANERNARPKQLAALPSPRDEYAIPVAPTVAGSQAERVLEAVVIWLTNVVRDNPELPQLVVVAPVRARESGQRVIVTFRDPRLLWDDGSSVAMGDVTLVVTPRERGFYDFIAHLPGRYEFRDEADETTLILTIGDRRISGTFWDLPAFFTVVDGALREIRLVAVDGETPLPVFSVGSLSVDQRLTDEGDGRWGGSFDATVSDIWNSEVGAAGKLRFGVTWSGIDVGGWRGIIERFGLDTPEGAAALAPAQAVEFAEALQAMRWGVVSAELSASDIELGESSEPVFSAEGSAIRLSFDGSRELATLGFGLRGDDVSIADDEVSPELLPMTAALDLTVDRVPLPYLMPAMLSMMVPLIEASDEVLEVLTVAAMTTDTSVLSDARTEVLLNDLTLDTPVFSVSATGSVTLDPNSSKGGVGAFEVIVNGLEEFLDRFLGFVMGPERQPACIVELREIAELSSDATEADPVYRYHIVISPEGSVTINDTPSQSLESC